MGRRLPHRARNAVFIFVMTLLMGLTLSAVMTLQSTGVDAAFWAAWLERFARTYVMVVPTVLVMSPVANRLTDAIVAGPPASSVVTRSEREPKDDGRSAGDDLADEP